MSSSARTAVELRELIEGLSRPEAYPHPVERVEVVQTHISCVFLAGEWVYKLKKPLDLGFLDYSTPEARRACCEAEVRLNQRLARDVYQGVAAIWRGPEGQLHVGGLPFEGEVVEHAVVMRRLDDARTFAAALARGELEAGHMDRLGALLAEFHERAARDHEIARWGGFDVVAGNCRENFAQLAPLCGRELAPGVPALDAEVLRRLERLTEAELQARRALIEARAAAGVPCDTHGDLRLEHVYELPERGPGQELVVVDCIEFNERFRFADPIAELAFPVMELSRAAREDLAERLAAAYLRAREDEAGAALLPLYTAYRATVRAKVSAMKAAEPEVPAAERARAAQVASGHLVQALGVLSPPAERPALVLVTGLPGTGKSTLAARLHARGFEWVRSDLVRKELAGIAPTARGGPEIYTREFGDRTYEECRARAERVLARGGRVVVDACFAREDERQSFLATARRRGARALVLRCQAAPLEVRGRMEERALVPGPSDADFAVYEEMAGYFEPSAAPIVEVDTAGDAEATWDAAAAALARAGLL
ncbi:MAG: AAA family ATPase [Planctomycetota bacterium]